MKYCIHITEPAKTDIRNTINYIGNVLKNPTTADRLLTKIEFNIASLSVTPQRCALADDPVLSLQKIRYLIIRNYYAFYQIDESTRTVHILRFLYEKSDWKNILKHSSLTYDENMFSSKGSDILSDVK